MILDELNKRVDEYNGKVGKSLTEADAQYLDEAIDKIKKPAHLEAFDALMKGLETCYQEKDETKPRAEENYQKKRGLVIRDFEANIEKLKAEEKETEEAKKNTKALPRRAGGWLLRQAKKHWILTGICVLLAFNSLRSCGSTNYRPAPRPAKITAPAQPSSKVVTQKDIRDTCELALKQGEAWRADFNKSMKNGKFSPEETKELSDAMTALSCYHCCKLVNTGKFTYSFSSAKKTDECWQAIYKQMKKTNPSLAKLVDQISGGLKSDISLGNHQFNGKEVGDTLLKEYSALKQAEMLKSTQKNLGR